MGTALRILQVAAALCLATMPWAQAQGCSLEEDYVGPSNFELVQISDAIVVATALAKRRDREEDETFVVFQVGERVKGNAASRVRVEGDLGHPRPSDQDDIASSHPDGERGTCNRRAFRKGERYLLFLEKGEDGRLRDPGYPYSRINEDYAGEHTTWMRTVRRYLRIQATAAPMEQIAILERLAESGRGLAGERLKPVEIRDIRNHLGSLSPWKPTAYLLAAYAALERGKMPSHVVGSSAADRQQSQLDAITGLVFGEPASSGEQSKDLAAMRLRLLTALVDGRHPEAMPLFDRLAAETPEDPDRIGLALRFFAKNGAYGRAFQWVETRLMNRLAQFDAPAAGRLVGHVIRMQSGEEGKEPWRSDARAAALWPELALDLYWYQVRTFGEANTYSLRTAIRTLPFDDYRARPLLTRARAASYEKEIVEWAASELADEAKRKSWEELPEVTRKAGANPAELPLQILLADREREKHASVLEQVFCQSEARGLLLIRTFGEAGHKLNDKLILRIAASALSDEQRAALPEAIEQWGRRYDDFWVDKGRAARVMADFREGKLTAAPIECSNGKPSPAKR